MYLKNVRPGHTYRMGHAVFTVALVRVGIPHTTVVTMGDKANGVPDSIFSRSGLTTVEEVK